MEVILQETIHCFIRSMQGGHSGTWRPHPLLNLILTCFKDMLSKFDPVMYFYTLINKLKLINVIIVVLSAHLTMYKVKHLQRIFHLLSIGCVFAVFPLFFWAVYIWTAEDQKQFQSFPSSFLHKLSCQLTGAFFKATLTHLC